MSSDNRPNILIVDDEPEICTLLAEKLRRHNITCQQSDDSSKAFEQICKTNFDVVIADISMPGMTGLELLEKTRKQCPTTQVILITGIGCTDWVKQAMRSGAFDYMDKPLNLDKLLERVLAALGSPLPATDRSTADLSLSQADQIDPLTGLLTHRHFMERLVQMREQYQREDQPLGLCLSDVDQFRQLNIASSFRAGDKALQQLANRLRQLVRTSDIIGRYGGDELITLLPGANLQATWALAERIRKSLRDEPIRLEDSGMNLTVSMGLIQLPAKGHLEVMEYLDRAVQAAYHAKFNGPGTIIAWSHELTAPGKPTSLHPDMESVKQMTLRFRQLNQRLTSMTVESARALAAAVEAKDPHTKWHSLNVAKLSQLLAQELGLPRQQVQIIHATGLLHDIGKIGIPDSVLTKSGPLTDEEYDLIKQHPAIGVNILEQTSFFHAELPLILHHHERYDGDGYPEGLAGQKIPLGARILHITDSIEAMLAKRTYKESYSLEKVISELHRCKSTQFDPMVAQIAIKNLQNGTLQQVMTSPEEIPSEKTLVASRA